MRKCDGIVELSSGYAACAARRAGPADRRGRSQRQNLRRELAWLRRGAPPARTCKPKFRIEAANQLITGACTPPRNAVELVSWRPARLGKDTSPARRVGLVPAF